MHAPMNPRPTLAHRLRRGFWPALLALAFLAGMALDQRESTTHADSQRDGYNNMVLEITEEAGPVPVYAQPTFGSAELDTLYWGDRVLWTGESRIVGSTSWIKVGIGDGRTGWMVDGAGWTVVADAVFTTPGMGTGAVVAVTREGSGSNCRVEPTSSATRAQTMALGEQMTVIGGPYQAEYWIWWQYELASGSRCWIIDIPGWFEVLRAGTF